MIGSLATGVRVRVCHDDAPDDGDQSRRLGVSASGLRGCNAVAPGPLARLEAPSRQSSSKAAPRQAAACSTTLTRAPEVDPQSRSLMRCRRRAEQLSGPVAIAAARSGPTSRRRRVGGRPENSPHSSPARSAGDVPGLPHSAGVKVTMMKTRCAVLAISAKRDAGERA
jgi:hypothetical protein